MAPQAERKTPDQMKAYLASVAKEVEPGIVVLYKDLCRQMGVQDGGTEDIAMMLGMAAKLLRLDCGVKDVTESAEEAKSGRGDSYPENLLNAIRARGCKPLHRKHKFVAGVRYANPQADGAFGWGIAVSNSHLAVGVGAEVSEIDSIEGLRPQLMRLEPDGLLATTKIVLFRVVEGPTKDRPLARQEIVGLKLMQDVSGNLWLSSFTPKLGSTRDSTDGKSVGIILPKTNIADWEERLIKLLGELPQALVEAAEIQDSKTKVLG